VGERGGGEEGGRGGEGGFGAIYFPASTAVTACLTPICLACHPSVPQGTGIDLLGQSLSVNFAFVRGSQR